MIHERHLPAAHPSSPESPQLNPIYKLKCFLLLVRNGPQEHRIGGSPTQPNEKEGRCSLEEGAPSGQWRALGLGGHGGRLILYAARRRGQRPRQRRR